MLVRILTCVSDPLLGRRLARLCRRPTTVVRPLRPGPRLWQRLAEANCDLLIAHRSCLPEPATTSVHTVLDMPDRPDVIVLTETEDAESRAHLLGAGCLAVLNTSLPDAALGEAFAALLDKRRRATIGDLAADRPADQFRLDDFVSLSPRMQKFMAVARKVVDSDSSLLILGETGVGKERLARAIHREGPRANGPFVVVNCGAIPETLLESELFGHEKGAFTGAVRAHRGYFELAHTGTIFLDEIGDMPLHLQVRLLRVLQERRIQRLGSESSLFVDARVMAATNRDLAAELAAKRFRPDLYYRLSVVTLALPPLRERREDIPALVDSYLGHYRVQLRRPAQRIAPEALAALGAYAWPGNVRELVNVLERAVLLCQGEEIGLADLPESITGERRLDPAAPAEPQKAASAIDDRWLDLPLGEARRAWLASMERAYLAGVLRRARGRIGESAARAGIDPRSLYTKMKAHGLRKEDFKA